jgi:2-polyprenyl-6-methoxyphenol hydroxylase-like FAD-dependent oxidoreductase
MVDEVWIEIQVGSFGQAPLDGDLVYFWAAAHVAGAAEAVSRRDLGAFRQVWRRVLPAAADLLERVSSFDDLLVNTVRQVDCRRWFSGRLVLLGDAAHAMAPNLGQGANSALVDGVVLAEELAGAPSVMDALTGYDKRRRGTLCWRDWPSSLGSARKASVGPWPPTSERSDRHPYSATPAEPTITTLSRP